MYNSHKTYYINCCDMSMINEYEIKEFGRRITKKEIEHNPKTQSGRREKRNKKSHTSNKICLLSTFSIGYNSSLK